MFALNAQVKGIRSKEKRSKNANIDTGYMARTPRFRSEGGMDFLIVIKTTTTKAKKTTKSVKNGGKIRSFKILAAGLDVIFGQGRDPQAPLNDALHRLKPILSAGVNQTK